MMRRATSTGLAALAALSLVAACSTGAGAAADHPTTPPTTTLAGAPTGSPTSARGAEPFSITIAAAGDLLTHVPVRNDAARFATGRATYDFRPMFADVKPLLSEADIAICHMETPLTTSATGLSRPGTLVFNTPHELVDAVKDAGYDGCDFASNHTWDQGLTGLKRTEAIIRAAGLQYAGPSADPNAPESVATYDANGVTVVQLGYSYTILNNWGPNTQTPHDAPWLKAALWPSVGATGIIAAARKARAAGADVVVVSLHWGQEYVSMPTKDQTALATALLGSGAVDVILGTHVHVVQPCATINGRYVFYGLGNSLSNQAPSQAKGLRPETQEGMVATVTISRDAAGAMSQSATYQPTRVDLAGHVIRLATKATNPTTWHRTVRWVGALGPGVCGATPVP